MDSQILTAFEKMRKYTIIKLYANEQTAQQLHDIEAARKLAKHSQNKIK
jgi:hypothetical protein